jgi:hypothetical protein
MDPAMGDLLTAIAVLLAKAWGIGLLVRILLDPVRN